MKKQVKSDSRFAEDWLPVIDIKNGMIEVEGSMLSGGRQYVTGVRIEPKNIFIADADTQNQVLYGMRNFYNTLDYEFWLVCCDRPVDIGLYKSQLELLFNDAPTQEIRKLIMQDIQKCDMFIGPEINAVDTEYYILFKDSVKDTEKIQKKIHNLIANLAQAGLNARQLTEDDARVILDGFFNDGKKVEFGTVMADV